MRLSLAAFLILLTAEGILAGLASRNFFLLTASLSGFLVYTAAARRSEGLGETVRAIAAGLIAIAAPSFYQGSPFALVMCFLALAHLLAATQAVWELSWGQLERISPSIRMRSLVFTIGFYAALALAVMLLRTSNSPLPPPLSTAAAALTSLLAVQTWDSSRLLRLRRALPPNDSRNHRRLPAWLSGLLLYTLLAALFSTFLPLAADTLCRISPRWNPFPERVSSPDTPDQSTSNSDQIEQRQGTEASSATQRHALPDRSDIQSSNLPRLFLKPANPDARRQLASQPTIYVRSHSMDVFADNAWTPLEGQGSWITDADDGTPDGWITLETAGPNSIPHEIFLVDTDGSSLPALANVSAYQTDRLRLFPSGTAQLPASGSVRYGAVSSPQLYDILLADDKPLAPATPPSEAHLAPPDTPVIDSLLLSDPSLRNAPASLEGRIATLRSWLAANITYSTRMTGREGLSGLDNFLTGERAGYCDFFATAACLFLRAQGIPSRITYGYAGNSFDQKRGVFVFSGAHAHAWTEIFLKDHGWTICDFTPPASIGNLGSPSTKEDQPEFDEGAFTPLAPDADNTAAPSAPPPDTSPWADKFIAFFKNGQWLDSLTSAFPIAGLLAASLVAWSLWIQRKNNNATASSSFADDLNQPLYLRELVRIASKAGQPHPRGATVREYFKALLNSGFLPNTLLPILDYHYAIRYEDQPSDPSLEKRFLSSIRSLVQSAPSPAPTS